jgi:ABC-2 type transport system ATP-binding protein
MTTSEVLRLDGIAAGYDKKTVIAGIDLAIARGEWFALLGPNGSGKTTLLHCVGGLHWPSSGSVTIGGYSLKSAPREAKRRLGFASAPERLPGLLTGRQCLEVYAAAKELPRIDEDVLTLAEEFRYTPMLDLFVDTYSLGTRQKLAVLLALLGEPEIVERYADRAALLLNGGLVQQWRKEEIVTLGSASEGGFEAAIAAISSNGLP